MNLTAVLWGFLGFLLGYLAGIIWPTDRKSRVPAKTRSRKTTAVQKSRRGGEQWIGPVVLLLAILMGVQYMYQINHERKTSACQTRFNQAFAKQLTIRSELASQAQANVDKIILSIGKMVSPPTTKVPTAAERKRLVAEYRKLFTDFAKESAAIQEKRKNTPLPSLPADGCDDNGTPVAESTVLADERARVSLLEAQLDASRAAILAQMPGEMVPVKTSTSAAPVRTVVVREPTPDRTEPSKAPAVVVNVPKPEASVVLPPTMPEQPIAEQACLLNLLGICVDL